MRSAPYRAASSTAPPVSAPRTSATFSPPSFPASSRPLPSSSSDVRVSRRPACSASVQQSYRAGDGCSPRRSGWSHDDGSTARSGSRARIRAAASSSVEYRSPARSGVTSRTASTRVGEPGWPNRLSYSRRSSTRSRAVQTSICPSASPVASCALASDTTAGSEVSHFSKPSSVTRVARMVFPVSSVSTTLVRCWRSRNAATSGGTCHVSESVVLRPQTTRSTSPSFSIAIASVRDVPSVSATAKTRSERWMQRSAPRARHARSASFAWGGPIVIAITSPPFRSFNFAACATAAASKGLSRRGTPSRLSCFVSWSNSIESARGTCLTRQTIFTCGSLGE